jgi:hypothetical protein
MTTLSAAGFLINSDWLKYGFIGFAAILALAAVIVYQTSKTKSVPMLISYLVFALLLAAMGLVSPMIHDSHDDVARQKERDESAQQISALQEKLENVRDRIKDLIDLKTGSLTRLQKSSAVNGSDPENAIHNAIEDLKEVDEKILGALQDGNRVKEQLATKP